MLIIIAERDTPDPFSADGAIVFEQKTNISDDDVREHAQSLATSGKYGKVWVAEVDLNKTVLINPLSKLIFEISSVFGVSESEIDRFVNNARLYGKCNPPGESIDYKRLQSIIEEKTHVPT